MRGIQLLTSTSATAEREFSCDRNRVYLTHPTPHSIWKGHAAMNAVDALQTWDLSEAWQISIDLAKAIDGNHMLNVDTAINLLCKLDYMKEYHAFGLLRVLNRSDLALTLKGDVEKHAKEMNSMVGFLFDVLPYEELKKWVRQQPELKHAAIGDAPLLYCETGKALVTLGILPHENSTTSMS